MNTIRHARPLFSAGSSLMLAATLGLTTGCATTGSSRSTADNYAVIDGQAVPVPDVPMGNPRTVARIINLGQTDNRVMQHLDVLCNTYGARLTGSTSLEDASRWARDQFIQWNLSNARLERWGEIATRFDRGPSTVTASMPVVQVSRDAEGNRVRETVYQDDREFEFTTLAWVKGTDGPVTGDVLRMPQTQDELNAIEDQIAGAWLLLPNTYDDRRGIRSVGFMMRERAALRKAYRAYFADPDNTTHPEAADDALSGTWEGTMTGPNIPEGGAPFTLTLDLTNNAGTMSIPGFHEGPIAGVSRDGETLTFTWTNPLGPMPATLTLAESSLTGEGQGPMPGMVYPLTAQRTEAATATPGEPTILERILKLNPAGFVSSSRDERVWTTSPTGWMEREIDTVASDIEINVRQSDYDYLNSRITDNAAVRLTVDLDHKLERGPIPVYNVIAEIPGTEFPDEVVIVSGHLDSWNGPGSQGTVDNATGCSTTMEAARLLMAAGAKPKRTIKFILWTGEEQGLIGARRYVEALNDQQRASVSACFVDDGGTNYQGGIPAADFMVDYLAAATAPVNGKFYSETDHQRLTTDDDPDNDTRAGWLDINIRPTGDRIRTHSGSDHAAFNEVGIPGFFWDEVGRANYRYAWHTQNDRIDQAIPEYLEQSAVSFAVTAYNLACAPTLLPREGDTLEEDSAETTASASE